MPKYRINELSFIGNILVPAGTEIESTATPSAHWEPLDKPADKARAAADAAEATRIAALKEHEAALQAAMQVVASAQSGNVTMLGGGADSLV